MGLHKLSRRLLISCIFAVLMIAATAQVWGQAKIDQSKTTTPWMNRNLSPDQRADLVIEQMTPDEKIQLVHVTGWGGLKGGAPVPPRSNLGAGFIAGIDRLGIPDINMADSAVGVRLGALQSRYSTLLPSVLGAAASWDPQGAFLYGSVIGRELRDQGYNMSIGGGAEPRRQPPTTRPLQYAGESP